MQSSIDSEPLATIGRHLAGPTRDNQYSRLRNGFANLQRLARCDKPPWVNPEPR
jgi:hypothetical protein